MSKNKILNFKDLKNLSIKRALLKDIKFLFKVYNESIVGKYSKTKKLIDYDDHKSWYLKSLNSKKNKFKLIEYSEKFNSIFNKKNYIFIRKI